MKPITAFYLFFLLLAAPRGMAQTVLLGDSCYLTFQPGEDSLATIVARLGQHYHKTELLTFVHGLMTGGGDMHGTRLDGYALRYKKLGATFCVDNETGHLYRIQLGHRASIISARGIRPGAATFATIIERYGPSQRGKELEGQPRVQEFSFDRKVWFTALRYPNITFISRGKPIAGENLMARRVQEIWLW